MDIEPNEFPEESDIERSNVEESNIEESEEIPKKPFVPCLARVEYDYEARETGELSLDKGDMLTVLEQDQGWWKGDLNGKIGVFPANHVKLIETQNKSVDEDDENEGKGKITKKLMNYGVKPGGLGSLFSGGFPLKNTRRSQNTSESSGYDEKTEEKHVSRKTNRSSSEDHSEPSKDNKLATPPSPEISREHQDSIAKPVSVIPPLPPKKKPPKPKRAELKAKVIYEYDADGDDEINLKEEEVVVILDKSDDDWWKGRNENGEVGLFPSNYVELITEKEQVVGEEVNLRSVISEPELRPEPESIIGPVLTPEPELEFEPKSEFEPSPQEIRTRKYRDEEDSPTLPKSPSPSLSRRPTYGVNILSPPIKRSSTSSRRSLHESSLDSSELQSDHEDNLPTPRRTSSEGGEAYASHGPSSLVSPTSPTPPTQPPIPFSSKPPSSGTRPSKNVLPDIPVDSEDPPVPPPRIRPTSQYEIKTEAPKSPPVPLARPPSVPKPGFTPAKPPSVPRRSSTSNKNISIVSSEKINEKSEPIKVKSPKLYSEEPEDADYNTYESTKEPEEEVTEIEKEVPVKKDEMDIEVEKNIEKKEEMEVIAKEQEEIEVIAKEPVEKEIKEKETELPPIPVGPKLTSLNVSRPAIKGRRPPGKNTVTQSQNELLEQAIAKDKEEVEEPKDKSNQPTLPSKPIKPMKPNMFKLPFAGGGMPTLRSVPKKPIELSSQGSAESKNVVTTATTTTNTETGSKPSFGGVRSYASKFNVPNQSTDVEFKLKKWFNEEINKVKTHFETQLAVERKKREELEDLVREIESRFDE
ncbi:3320_t:CDS:10 [Diversispora eburnea]|uniref:3320_t:CDS:1 n=1 Tax=Diversispora eburnea TaxID=1213867 RepID=A0A9N8W016_9GLOM|nr:3320_t:CDS:10 [Diversispora eburnea]